MNVLILFGEHEAPAIQEIYFNNPLSILKRNKEISYTFLKYNDYTPNMIAGVDFVIISRVFDKYILNIMASCYRRNVKVFFFLDDHVLNFPQEYYLSNEPFYLIHEKLIIDILRQASGLIVSTEIMKKTYLKYNETVFVTNPCVKISLFNNEIIKQRDGDSYIIGYAGSFGHVVDFKFIEKALFDFFTNNYPKVKIEFMGCVPDLFRSISNDSNIKIIPWTSNYLEYLQLLNTSQWDLAICPVLESDYSCHKSNIKFLEYSITRKLGIYSNIIIYNQDVENGVNGFLADNTYDSWLEKFEYCFRNDCRKIFENAFRYVSENYSDYKSSLKWKEILILIHDQRFLFTFRIFKLLILIFKHGFAFKKINMIKKYGIKGAIVRWIRYKSQKNSFFRIFFAIIKLFKQGKFGFIKAYTIKKSVRAQVYKDKRIDILFIIPWMTVGGGDKVNLDIAKYIDREKFRLHFLTTLPSKNEWKYLFSQYSDHITHLTEILGDKREGWEYNTYIIEYLRKYNIKKIVISNSSIGYDAIPAIKDVLSDVFVVDILHGQGGEKEGGGFPHYSAPYDAWIDKRITINKYLKKYIIQKYNILPSKISVVYNGIDHDIFKKVNNMSDSYLRAKYKFTEDEIIVSYIGRLNYEKHPEIILQIANALKQNCKIKFMIVGDGELYTKMLEFKASHVLDNVFFEGYSDKIKGILSDTDILLLCSEMEGLPIVLLEAMSMEVACIATNVGGIPELIDNGINGYLVDYNPDMREKYTRLIEMLVRNRSLRKKIGQAARKKISINFSMLQTIKKYEAIFQK